MLVTDFVLERIIRATADHAHVADAEWVAGLEDIGERRTVLKGVADEVFACWRRGELAAGLVPSD